MNRRRFRGPIAVALHLFVAAPVSAQDVRVGIIDFYALRHVPEDRARALLGISEGDLVVRSGPGQPPEAFVRAERQLETLPGVARARINAICCDAGRVILFVGIEERGAPMRRFRKPPTGSIRLPADVVQAGEELSNALQKAIVRGDAEEDDSKGHALAHDPVARAIQERFVGYAARDAARLRHALRHASDETHRALAAQVLGYAADKRSVAADLMYAMGDSSEHVRNDAMRALALIAGFAATSPGLGIRVPFTPFIDLLASPVWTDLNKASMALEGMSGSRNPELFAALRARALPALVEMARWKSDGHAGAAFWLLGRVGGLSEDAIRAAWDRRDRQAVIDAAVLHTIRR